MDPIIIPLDGIETELTLERIDTKKLELDELNPRISFYRDNQVTDQLSEDQIVFALVNKKPEAFRKLKDSIHNEIIIGKTIIDKIKEAVNKLNPELIVFPKNGAIISRTKGTNTRRAQSPKTTDGTPASTSMNGLTIFLNFFGAYSAI